MSWFGAIKKDNDPREERRRQLEDERRQRKEARLRRQQQLQAAQLAQEEANQACSDLLNIDPDILTGEDAQINDSEIENLLAIMDFDAENGVDGANAMDKMASVKCEFTRDDIEFWFTVFGDPARGNRCEISVVQKDCPSTFLTSRRQTGS